MKKNGFTIIELLVVIAVISIIVSISIGMFGTPRAKSRDARRLADMQEIRNALNLYVNDHMTYPNCPLTQLNGADDCLSTDLKTAGSIQAVPKDPQNSGSCAGLPDSPSASSYVYCYEAFNNATSFVLYYHLEVDSINPAGWHSVTP